MTILSKNTDQNDQDNLNHDPITGGPTQYPDPSLLEANHPLREKLTPEEVGNVETPFEEDKLRQHLKLAPYYRAELDFDRDYLPAYRLGITYKEKQTEKNNFDEIEGELQAKWEELKGESRLQWEHAKDVILDLWYSLFGKHER